MSARSRVLSFLRNLLRRENVERELDDELRSFVEMAVDEKRLAGHREEDARRGVLLELGGLDQVKEERPGHPNRSGGRAAPPGPFLRCPDAG